MKELSLENLDLKMNKLTKKSLYTIYGGDGEIVINDNANAKIARLKVK